MAEDRASLKTAVATRGKYIRSHIESLSMKAVRRLLEGDLGLETGELDREKEQIKVLVDKVLQMSDDDEPAEDSEETEPSPKQKRKRQEEAGESGGTEEDEGSEHDESEEEDEDEKGVEKGSKPTRSTETKARVQKKTKTPEAAKQSHGRRCERLKGIIQQCGLRVPPAVYAKAKRASADEREDILASELEAVLEKEGLSTNPTPKEITAAKKMIQKRKELEGIDSGNVILAPRSRRAAAPAPQYVVASESDEDGSSNEDEGEDEDQEEGDDDNEGDAQGSGESADESEGD